MLRTVLRTRLRPAIQLRSRSLVSPVLLSRTYENESVADLKKIAKDRGLSPYVLIFSFLSVTPNIFHRKGNKATLISRIQQHEQHKFLQAVSSAQDPPVPAGAQVRHASV